MSGLAIASVLRTMLVVRFVPTPDSCIATVAFYQTTSSAWARSDAEIAIARIASVLCRLPSDLHVGRILARDAINRHVAERGKIEACKQAFARAEQHRRQRQMHFIE